MELENQFTQNGNNWELILTPATHEAFKEQVLLFIEIEIMQGKKEDLPDGRIKYNVVLDDEMTTIFRQSVVKSLVKRMYDSKQN